MLVKKSLGLLFAAAIFGWQAPAQAQIVPGTGQQLTEVADDFEDDKWSFVLNLPKASSNIDKVDRQPTGYSTNGMWFESGFRGTPDFVKRVDTPEGGLPGSKGALAMQTLYSGIPGQLSNKFQQDDLIANVSQKLGFMLPATWTPSYTVRVFIPPFEQWEQRVGSSFGFRADCQTIINKPTKVGRLFRTGGTSREMEQYWPGFFIQFNAKNHPQHPKENSATILMRSGERGEDIQGPVITKSGWWTLGMTITPDGKVHYYGHEGVANLTSKDHLYSNFPYGYKCLQSSTYFFNIVNQDDGRTWSTRWIVDDPKVFVATRPYTAPPQTAGVPAQRISQTKPIEATTPAVTPPATQPAVTPVAPVQPIAPAQPTTRPAAPVAPAATPVSQVAPTATQIPALQSVPAAPTGEVKGTAPNPQLPGLSSTPSPVIPVKAVPATPAPALLPDESPTETAAAVEPAPMALPQDDAPMLPPPAVEPPAPAVPQ